MSPSTRSAPPAMGSGIGLKPAHYRAALESDASGLWVEVHPENYMVSGGPRLHWLEAMALRRPVSLHGVSLSLGGADRPDPDHLTALRGLIDRYQPALVSEHLAWCRHDGIYYGDLLPLPYTSGALDRFCDHVDETQDALGRAILIENPSLYVPLTGDMSETDFLAEAVRRTGCGLLLDLNNVFVTAANLKRHAHDYLRSFPLDAVGEIHLAGHEADPDGSLLIDTHGAPIHEAVWSLYRETIGHTGPVPTLIERDNNLPPFAELMAERDRAQVLLEQTFLKHADEAALADA